MDSSEGQYRGEGGTNRREEEEKEEEEEESASNGGDFDADSDAWLSDDKEVEIKKACVIRLRLLGVMCDTTQITAVGTIKDDFLGLISHPDNQGF